MDKFNNFLNFNMNTYQIILKLIANIDNFKGKWSIVKTSENQYLKELRKIATVESIGSSTRIEGATLTDQEVKNLLDNIKISKLKNRDEQEVIGYYDALEIIYDNYEGIKLNENYLKQLHQILLKYSEKDDRHRGNYKNISNNVVAKYPNGKQKIIFKTTSPELVQIEIRELLEWVHLETNKQNIHPLIIIGLFIYEFLSIHPFQDGNGRLSRLLTTLILLQNEYEFIQYISFENHIEQNKKDYYEALMFGQKNRGTENEKIDKWLIFFLDSINILTSKLERKYNIFKSKGGYFNERQKNITQFIKLKQPVKLSDISNNFTQISYNTIKKDLIHLRNEGVITLIGKSKGSFYIIKD